VLNSLARIKINMIKINKQGQVSEDNHKIGIKIAHGGLDCILSAQDRDW
jgi:hypothetical protein